MAYEGKQSKRQDGEASPVRSAAKGSYGNWCFFHAISTPRCLGTWIKLFVL